MIDEKKLIEKIHEYFKIKIDNAPSEYIDLEMLTLNKEICEIVKYQPNVYEWIPCSERMPKVENREYLISKRERVVMIAVWTKAGWNTFKKNDGTYDDQYRFSNVIAWMPLPEPMKVE